MSTPTFEEAKAAALTAANDARARRAAGDATVTEGEALAAANLYATAKPSWNLLDAMLSIVTERTAVGEKFHAV